MSKSVYTKTYQIFLAMLVEARTEAGVTQVELAQKIGWQQTDISKVERGERRLDIAEFLLFSKAIEIDVAKFIKQLQSK